MKKLLILLVSVWLMGCQKEFPSAPDYSEKNQLIVSENWKYEMPEEEKVVWVGVVDNNIIYLTNNEAQTKLSTYTFGKSGELISTRDFTEPGIAKDVFEHIDEYALPDLLTRLRSICKTLFVAVPLGVDDVSHKFVVPAYHSDVTHITIKSKSWWRDLFEGGGFEVVSESFEFRNIKRNWVSRYPKGNAFFVLK